jgi:hypothetical protein
MVLRAHDIAQRGDRELLDGLKVAGDLVGRGARVGDLEVEHGVNLDDQIVPPGSPDATHLAWQYAGEAAYSTLARRPQTPAVRMGTSEKPWSQLPVPASSTNC